jgi:hypothetical protein
MADVSSALGKAAHALCRLKDEYVLPPDIADELQAAFDEFKAAEFNLTDQLHRTSRRLEELQAQIEAELKLEELRRKNRSDRS